MTERMSIDKGELSVERQCDMSVLIKQICKESDVMSLCVLCLSGLRRMLECCTRLSGTLQSVTGMFLEKGMSGSDLRRSHHSETVGILKQLMDETRVDLETLEKMESELFKAERAQFVELKGLITRLINRLETEISHISDCNEEMLMIDGEKENPEVDDTSSFTMFTSLEVIDKAGFVSTRLTLDESKNIDTAKGPNSIDSKGLNCQDCKIRVHINKQSPDNAEDVAGGVHVDKGDSDDLVVQVRQAQIVENSRDPTNADC